MALLLASAGAAGQTTVTVRWGGTEESYASVLGSPVVDLSRFDSEENTIYAVTGKDGAPVNLTGSWSAGESYTTLSPASYGEYSYVNFGLTHDKSSYPYGDSYITDYYLLPARVEFTAYATVEAGDNVKAVFADVYIVREGSDGKEKEELLEANVSISTAAESPTTYKRLLGALTVEKDESYSVRLRLRWVEEIDTEARATFTSGETYMIQEVNTGGYVGGGYNWGTQAALLPQPQQFTFTGSDDTYTLSSYIYGSGNNLGFSSSELYLDRSLGEALSFFFIPGTESGTYYIGFNSNSTDYYLVADGLYGPVTYTEDVYSASLFRIVTQDDLRTAQADASEDNPVDVTGLIWNPTLNRESETTTTYWTVKTYDGGSISTSPSFGYSGANASAGTDNTWANVIALNGTSEGFDIYQEVELKAGTYRFSLHGFYYYQGSTADDGLTVVYATPSGSSSVSYPLMSNMDASEALCNGNDWDHVKMYRAYQDFRDGYYPAEIEFTVDNDNTLVRLGVKGKNASDWYCWGELNLTYYGGSAVDNTHECEVEHWTLLGAEEAGDGLSAEEDGSISYSVSDGSLPASTVSHETLGGLSAGAYLVSIDVKAETEPSVTSEGDAERTFPDGNGYMLQVVNEEGGVIGYLGGGNAWDTQASILPQPQQFTFETEGEYYILSSYIYNSDKGVNSSANHLGLNSLLYFDQGTGLSFSFEAVDGSDDIYKVGFNNGSYQYLTAETLPASCYGAVTYATSADNALLFRVITQEDLREKQESLTDGSFLDVTGLIWNPTLNYWSNNHDKYWNVESHDGTGTTPTVDFGYRNGENPGANGVKVSSMPSGFNVWQTVELKAGTYRFSAEGWKTAEEGDFSIYATPELGGGGTGAFQTGTSNSEATAYEAFRDNDTYLVTVEFTVDSDNTPVTLGFKGTSDADWCCWGELNLTYYGREEETGITFLANGAHTTIDGEGKSQSADEDGYVTYSVLCEVGEDGKLDISLDIPAEMETEYSSLSWKNLSYSYLGSTAELTPATGDMNSDLAEAQQEAIDTYNSSKTTENYFKAKAAIEAAQASADYYASVKAVVDALDSAGLTAWQRTDSYSAYDSGSLSETQVNKDLVAAQKAQKTAGSDMTYALLYKDNGESGEWTSPQGSVETSGTTGVTSTSGTGFSKGDVLSYSITGLPTGYYTVSFYALESGTTGGDNIAEVFANDVTQSISVAESHDTSEAVLYTLTVEVAADDGEDTGTLTLGIKNTGEGGNYAYCRLESLVFNMYERSVALSDVSIVCGIVSPEETEYQWAFDDGYVGNVPVEHKDAKWYGLREGHSYDDDFSDGEGNKRVTTKVGSVPLQNTHVYVDTIYMRKGTSIDLVMPTQDPSSSSSKTKSYNRWFNYLNDQSYYCGGHKVDGGSRLNLLTPASTSMKAWRFENGYVTGYMNSQYSGASVYTLYKVSFYYPTDDEYVDLSGLDNFKDLENGNAYYAVACDLSVYTDFAEYEKTQGGGTDFGYTPEDGGLPTYCEPTLAGRAVYYIIGLDTDHGDGNGGYKAPDEVPDEFKNYWAMLTLDEGGSSDYQKDGDGAKYLEEYEIAVPSRRVSCNTNETLTLPMNAESFGIPGEEKPGNLTVSITCDGDSIKLGTTSLSGTGRVIYYYKDGYDKSQWKIANGYTATICVTKTVGETTYNLVRYKLTFKDSCIPLTEPQVDELDTIYSGETVTYWWKEMTYRSEGYIADNLSRIESRTFDYDENYNAGTLLGGYSEHYPFPLGWKESGYAFYDGSKTPDCLQTDISGGYNHSTWGVYTILNDYLGYWDQQNSHKKEPVYCKRDRGYFLYVDATETPGTLMDLDLKDICSGSQIIATAWMKCSGAAAGSGNDDAAVLFTLSGVTSDKNGNEVHVPVYRQYSGQLPTTTYIDPLLDDEKNIPADILGKGSDTNEWFQIYFSFQTGSEYDDYTLRIDNNCASTNGGDFYLDDVRVYVRKPTPAASEVTPTKKKGSGSDVLTEVNLSYDFDTMLARCTGNEWTDYVHEEEESDRASVTLGFIMIDRVKYKEYLKNNPYDADSLANAILKSAVKFSTDSLGNDTKFFNKLSFYCYYYDNPTNEEIGSLFRLGSSSDEESGDGSGDVERKLFANIYCTASPYTPYLVLVEPNAGDVSEEDNGNWYSYFTDQVDGDCSIQTLFAVTDATRVWINGELTDATQTHCAGQIYHIAPTVTYEKPVTDEEGNDTTSLTPVTGVYFDFFYGTEEEFINPPTGDGYSESLKVALENFRDAYPKADCLVEPAEGATGYTTDDYDVIKYWADQENWTGDGSIAFYRQYLDVKVPDKEATTVGGIRLVIQPIETTIYGEDGKQVKASSWGYMTVKMEISGSSAPSVYTGFSNVLSYPENYMPALRMGLSQWEQITEEHPLTVSLRELSISDVNVELENDYLCLVDTDDPYYMYDYDGNGYGMFTDDFTQDKLEIGGVVDLDGTKLTLYFTDEDKNKYPFHEGYYYALVAHFIDTSVEDSDCGGLLPLEIKIVPEYLVWDVDEDDNKKDRNSNWNKDDNWKLVTKEDLPKYNTGYAEETEGEQQDVKGSGGTVRRNEEGTSTENTESSERPTPAFVPMQFSKIIIPDGVAAALYMDGYTEEDGKTVWGWNDDLNEDGTIDYISENPTANIQYDMLVNGGEEYKEGTNPNESLGRYHVNIGKEVYLGAGSMLLHPELMDCERVWINVELEPGKWTLMSVPLEGVVSGDWYTGTDGTESAEPFEEIKFGSGNDRMDPMVFQRSWGSDTKIVYTDSTDVKTPAYSSTGWTSVYNDASVELTPGEGFSVKAYRSDNGTNDIIFRFPKGDTSYSYYEGSTTTGDATTVSRTNAGKLRVADLVERYDTKDDREENTDELYSETDGGVTVGLPVVSDGTDYYCLVGNPFTAKLSLKEFFEENAYDVEKNLTGTLTGSYWSETAYGPVAGNGSTISLGEKDEDVLIEPYHAFFAQVESSKVSNNEVTITFTSDMQTLGSEDDDEEQTPNDVKAFTIVAEGAGGKSGAALAYEADASDGYESGEDVILLRDDSWSRDGLPLVYTVAGDRAVSINRLRGLTVIPLGVFSTGGGEYTLTFTGVDSLGEPSLYDAEEDTETPLTEGYTLDMQGASHGRYFIRTSADVTEEEDGPLKISAYSTDHRRVTVSSNAGIERVEVYSVGGTLQRRVFPNSVACTIDDIESGIAVVSVHTAEGATVRKITVK